MITRTFGDLVMEIELKDYANCNYFIIYHKKYKHIQLWFVILSDQEKNNLYPNLTFYLQLVYYDSTLNKPNTCLFKYYDNNFNLLYTRYNYINNKPKCIGNSDRSIQYLCDNDGNIIYDRSQEQINEIDTWFSIVSINDKQYIIKINQCIDENNIKQIKLLDCDFIAFVLKDPISVYNIITKYSYNGTKLTDQNKIPDNFEINMLFLTKLHCQKYYEYKTTLNELSKKVSYVDSGTGMQVPEIIQSQYHNFMIDTPTGYLIKNMYYEFLKIKEHY